MRRAGRRGSDSATSASLSPRLAVPGLPLSPLLLKPGHTGRRGLSLSSQDSPTRTPLRAQPADGPEDELSAHASCRQ